MVELRRRLAGEFLGSAFLVAAVVGSGIMASSLTRDVAVALLANTVATGAILVVLITIFGPVSGAHFNPAISLAFALRGELSWRDFRRYVAAQVAGAITGVAAAHLMFGRAVFQVSQTARTGPAQWFSEGVAAFGLALVILLGLRGERGSVAWLVGLYVSAGYWFTASTCFANPAVALARSLTDSFAGVRPIDLPGFLLAELVGTLLALAASSFILGPRRAEA
ncbi:aquaporin family protein [Chelatococcus sambhunathii]|uniref:Aquaporin family protein n=1 Tax=Chelatococcus sambhunathii TaxID=363953 RepID=A0ABU1DCI8_9HYPH|nr:MIP/aquaporin family protein [Chelatococcus sambhunathii]MDR4305812.1 aquaporin family protein [Chelatococcus sambhunathii]